jgi:heme/copper-type cytochrome/quinol oxidase subunit 2
VRRSIGLAVAVTGAAVLALAAAIVALADAPWRTAPTVAETPADGAREIRVRVYAWGFSPRVVRVSPGQTVRFVVRTDDIKHGFAVNELGINLELRPGEETRSPTLVVALPEGVYPIHCSAFCGLGHPSMKGKLVVGTPRADAGLRRPWIASLLAAAMVAGFTLVVGRARGRRA